MNSSKFKTKHTPGFQQPCPARKGLLYFGVADQLSQHDLLVLQRKADSYCRPSWANWANTLVRATQARCVYMCALRKPKVLDIDLSSLWQHSYRHIHRLPYSPTSRKKLFYQISASISKLSTSINNFCLCSST